MERRQDPTWSLENFSKLLLHMLSLFFVRYFNQLFSSGLYPDNWSEAIIQPLFKKGDPEIPDNYRGISLLSICSKLYSYILNKRLTCWIDDNNLLSETQAGFRKTYSTTDHLFTLLALIQKQLHAIWNCMLHLLTLERILILLFEQNYEQFWERMV